VIGLGPATQRYGYGSCWFSRTGDGHHHRQGATFRLTQRQKGEGEALPSTLNHARMQCMWNVWVHLPHQRAVIARGSCRFCCHTARPAHTHRSHRTRRHSATDVQIWALCPVPAVLMEQRGGEGSRVARSTPQACPAERCKCCSVVAHGFVGGLQRLRRSLQIARELRRHASWCQGGDDRQAGMRGMSQHTKRFP